MLVIVDYVWKVTVKKSWKYGEHGSFEHLLFLFCAWGCPVSKFTNDAVVWKCLIIIIMVMSV